MLAAESEAAMEKRQAAIMPHSIFTVLLVLLALACGSSGAWAQKIGPEFRVNTNTVGQKKNPSVARLSDGGFVVIWETWGYQSQAQDGSKHGVYGRRYSAAGVPAAGEFPVNTYTLNDQYQPSVAGLSDGGFVVTWTSFATGAAGQDGSRSGIYGQRYNAAGDPAGIESRINVKTNEDQEFSSVAGLSGGGFVVVWHSYTSQSSHDLFGRRYNAAGTAVAGEFAVNTHKTFSQRNASVAALSGGGFVVTWESAGQDNSGWGVYGQRYSATGARAGLEFPVNTHKALDQWESSVAGLTGGGFVVVWASRSQDGHLHGIYGQRYNAAGAPAGVEFPVNSAAEGNQDFPSVAGLSDGGFVVAWQSNNIGFPIFGQRYSATGAPLGDEFKVNTATCNNHLPAVAGLDKGEFVVAWDTTHAVWGQRFGGIAPKITLNPVSRLVRPPPPPMSVTFSADASGSPTPTVQWQQKLASQRFFTNISGATLKTLMVQATVDKSGNQYRAVFSNLAGKATTTAATLTVGPGR